MNIHALHSEYIAGKRIEESFGKYRMSCKVGSYCVFGYDQISNQRHYHDCYELCVVLSGQGSFLYCDEVYKIQEGDILVAEPGVKHEIQAGINENLILLYLFVTIFENSRPGRGASFGDHCIDSFLQNHTSHSSQSQLLSYIHFIEMYNTPARRNHFGTYEAIKNLILESLLLLSTQMNKPKEDVVKNIIENALDYIDTNLYTKIRVSEVAANSCTTQRNLEYLFKKQLHKTVIGYINEKKTELACHYLSMYFNIADTAEMVGINNVSQFSAMFKKNKNMSPQAYQKSLSGDKKGMGRRI